MLQSKALKNPSEELFRAASSAIDKQTKKGFDPTKTKQSRDKKARCSAKLAKYYATKWELFVFLHKRDKG